jgi:hypothetical protein
MMVYYFNSDANDAFVSSICGNLPMFRHAYLTHVKGYSERSINAILSGCSESYRLGGELIIVVRVGQTDPIGQCHQRLIY